ncbi:hypothetical protein J1N35_023404 [Gossypium stocksii]|uniref:Uncharacterized protein n=1 Tax=Gossypium stocksii TaxID=47602 RepID=A0A9D3VIP2_9ROSI|nr:hypothetical protein J1N35_023404 [Gossypium stocksii]
MSDEHLDNLNEEMNDESIDLNESESATPSVNSFRKQPPDVERENNRERDEKGRNDSDILRVLADALQRVVGTVPATTSVPIPRLAPIKELRKYGAVEFWVVT